MIKENLWIELSAGMAGYMVRRWLGEEITKYIISPISSRLKKYILMPLYKKLKKSLIKTERDAAIYLHYRNKALNNGHSHKSKERARQI